MRKKLSVVSLPAHHVFDSSGMNEKEAIIEALQKARRMALRLKRQRAASPSGAHPSVFKGQGMAFSDFREYIPGDDMRLMSWSMTAKTGKPYIKIFEEERESSLTIACDVSSSMFFGSSKRSKMEALQKTASFLACLAALSKDPLGLALFDSEVRALLPLSKNPSRPFHIARALCALKGGRRRTASLAPLERALRQGLKKGSRVFLLSDFLFPFAAPLRRLSLRYEMLCAVIQDSRTECSFPPLGLMDIEDLETGEMRAVDSSSSHFQAQFKALQKQRSQIRDKELALAKARRVFIDSQGDVYKPLMRLFQQKR